MTKVNTSSEPSMEEILASIRKIIAEEPPGSRPSPPPKPAIPEDRALGARDAFWRSPAPAPRAEPTAPARPLAPTPAAAASAPKFDGPFFPAAREPNPLLTRDEAKAAQEAEADHAATDTRNIDEQLSDLLNDDLKSIDDDRTQIPASGDRVDDATPSLTVSRVALEPKERATTVDPFEFDLGPSPFSGRDDRKTEEATSVQRLEEEGKGARKIEERAAEEQRPVDAARVLETRSTTFVPDPVVAAAQEALWSSVSVAEEAAAESVSAYVSAERSAQPSFKPVGAASAAPVDGARQQPPRPEPPFVVRDLHNTPSVAATIGPIRKLGPYPDILTPSPAAAPTAEQMARLEEERLAPESPSFVNRSGASAKSSEPETVLFQRADGALTPAPISMSMTDLDHRTMEDTVADLLRPMLKQWLSENMPKIVERALRRELLERSPNHKSAAE